MSDLKMADKVENMATSPRERGDAENSQILNLPQSWRSGTLGDVIRSVRGGFSVNCEDRQANSGERGVLKTGAVLNGRLDLSEHKLVLPGEERRVRTPVRRGAIIICRKNSEDVIGASALATSDHPNIFLSDLLWEILPQETIHAYWLLYTLQSDAIRQRIRRAATGTQSSMKNISQDRLLSIPIKIPSPLEQQRICEILRTWDEAIEKLEAVREVKHARFTGLCQKLLGRGGAYPNRWELRALSEISVRVQRQNGGDDDPVMTISAKSGFLMQSDKFSRDMAGRSVERYIVLNHGEFAYNKGNSLTAPYGCIFRLDRPTALVPFVYFCFALKQELNHEFYSHLFAAGALNHQLSRLINSGVRNDGLLNLNADDFFGCKVPVPPAEEQKKVAEALTAAKEEFALLDREIDTLARQKRGLMQKLLTGEWRVKSGDSGDG